MEAASEEQISGTDRDESLLNETMTDGACFRERLQTALPGSHPRVLFGGEDTYLCVHEFDIGKSPGHTAPGKRAYHDFDSGRTELIPSLQHVD